MATIVIHDLAGRHLRTLALEPGRTEVIWDGEDTCGRAMPSGIYFARYESSGATGTVKLVLLRESASPRTSALSEEGSLQKTAIVLMILLCVAGLCRADDNPADVVVWSQEPLTESPMAFASQQAVDIPFFAECVNDFESPYNVEINHVHWWGIYWGKKREELRISYQQVDWDGRPIGRALDCTGSQRVTCGADNLTGTTVGAPSNVDYYSCSSWQESGPEVVYQVKIPFPNINVTFTIDQGAQDLDLFLLTECDENTCITYGGTVINHQFAEPGTYYLVIDGYLGDAGPYALWIECQDVPSTYFCVRFYENAPVRGRNYPGPMLYEYWTEDYHEYTDDAWLYSYWADIPPFPVAAGHLYWASFQCVSERMVTGQWGSSEALAFELVAPYMDFEYLGVTRWTPFGDIGYTDTDLAFELFADPNPVERASWTTIKSLYR